MTINQKEKLYSIFALFDKDSSGMITLEEFEKGIKLQKLNMSDEDIQKVFYIMDFNNSGIVLFDEFVGIFLNNEIL